MNLNAEIPVSEHPFVRGNSGVRGIPVSQEFQCQSLFSRGGRPRRRGSRKMPRRWEMTAEFRAGVAPGDCSPGAPADPYLHFRAYGSSYHELATGRLPE